LKETKVRLIGNTTMAAAHNRRKQIENAGGERRHLEENLRREPRETEKLKIFTEREISTKAQRLGKKRTTLKEGEGLFWCGALPHWDQRSQLSLHIA
jgi:hypothetical protein